MGLVRTGDGKVIAPIIGGLVASMVLYLVFAALFGVEAGVLAVLVLGAIGFAGLVSTLILSNR